MATPKLPTEVSSVATPSNRCTKSPEEPGGANCTVKVSVPAFGAIVCMAGGAVTVNGNVGEVNPPTSMGFDDTFVKVTGSVTGLPPMGWGAQMTEVGEMGNEGVAG